MSDLIRKTAEQLRAVLDRAQEAGADIPWIARFPKNCCNFASNLLLLELSDAGLDRLRRTIGTVTDEKGDDLANHVWVNAGDFTVDITADCYGQPKVIVEQQSDWHNELTDVKPFIARHDVPEGTAEAELSRLRELYQDVLQILATYRENANG